MQDQIFSRIFDIKFESEEGATEHTHQLTFGINERALAAMLAIHSDNYGLRLLPGFAPIQIVLIPKPKLHEDHGIAKYTIEIIDKIKARVYIDENKNRTAKQKINHWRERGVPLILVIEPNDVQNQTISASIRTQNAWQTISADNIGQTVLKYFNEIEKQIREDAESFLEEKIKIAKSRNELVNLVGQNYIVKFAYCGSSECGINLEQDSVGEILGISVKEKEYGKCIGCGNESTVVGYFSRRAQSP